MKQEKLHSIIKKSFPDADIDIIDLVGDENHYSLTIKDKIFSGKTIIAQHRMVNSVLKEYLDSGELHALQILTKS